MPLNLAIWEAEVRKTVVQGQPVQKIGEHYLNKQA
jgi:hypothetical protein